MNDLKDHFPHLPGRIAGLGELAFNLWWSWHPEARMLFKMLDRSVWKDTRHNPVTLLTALPPPILQAEAADPAYLRHSNAVLLSCRARRMVKEYAQKCYQEARKSSIK